MNYQPWVSERQELAPLRSVPAVAPREARVRFLGAREAPAETGPSFLSRFLVAGVAASVAGVHGYKRHGGSKGWAFLWAVGGALCPLVTVAFVFSQGFGKRKAAE